MLDRIINIINPNNKELDTLTSDELLQMLIKLNRCLRVVDENEEVLAENMIAGNLVSPTKEVQLKTLDYLTQSMPKIQDKKAKATMMYYTLLNLHMFSNGNGRTSRFMFDLINGNLSEENLSFYFHKNSKITNSQKNNLEKTQGILDISEANQIPDDLLRHQLSFVPKEILLNYSHIMVGYNFSPKTTREIIPEAVAKELNSKELADLDKLLQDSFGVGLCPSGLAMLYVAQKRGELEKWIDLNNELFGNDPELKGRLNFPVYKRPEMISKWDTENFRDLISVGNAVKFARLKCLIDIFVEPEKNVNMQTGIPYANEILGNVKSPKDLPEEPFSR